MGRRGVSRPSRAVASTHQRYFMTLIKTVDGYVDLDKATEIFKPHGSWDEWRCNFG